MDIDVRPLNDMRYIGKDKKSTVLRKFLAEGRAQTPENQDPFNQPLSQLHRNHITNGTLKKEHTDYHQMPYYSDLQSDSISNSNHLAHPRLQHIKIEPSEPFRLPQRTSSIGLDYLQKFDSLRLENGSNSDYLKYPDEYKSELPADKCSSSLRSQSLANNHGDYAYQNSYHRLHSPQDNFSANGENFDNFSHTSTDLGYASPHSNLSFDHNVEEPFHPYEQKHFDSFDEKHFDSFDEKPFDHMVEEGFQSYEDMDENGIPQPFDEKPLDLSVPRSIKSEAYNHMFFEDCIGNSMDFSLKKIRTGTRSRVRSPKSWEFLLRLLQDSRSNPSMIKWEDERTGTFRLVQKDEIAKIWGMRSEKHRDGGLTYDNFARNLRYHYKTKMLVPVSEKHLVYRFSNEVMQKYYFNRPSECNQ